jgi:hypothetical protein
MYGFFPVVVLFFSSSRMYSFAASMAFIEPTKKLSYEKN